MKVSVCIPTLGRDQEPIDTVSALLKQSRIPDEIVIVDQNDPPLPALDAFLSQHPIVRHLRSKRTGVVYNMNVALRSAQGEIILYLDDDVVLDSGLVEAHLKEYGVGQCLGVSGRVEQPQGDQRPERIYHLGKYGVLTGKVYANFNAMRRAHVSLAPGGNMSFLRDKLLEIGGFDVGFVGNGYFFESDASLRFSKAFGPMIFNPAATLKHLAAPRGGCRILDKAEHHSYFVRNGFRLFRRHSPGIFLPVFVLRMLALTLGKALKNRDLRILIWGLRAMRVGMTQKMSISSEGIELSLP